MYGSRNPFILEVKLHLLLLLFQVKIVAWDQLVGQLLKNLYIVCDGGLTSLMIRKT